MTKTMQMIASKFNYKFVLLPFVFIPLLCLTYFYYNYFIALEHHSLFNELIFRISCENGIQEIKCWHDYDNEMHFLFLPSYADVSRITISLPDGVCADIDGTTIENSMDFYLSDELVGKEIEVTFYNMDSPALETGTLTILRSENIAAMFIDTETGGMESVHKNKDYKERANMLVVEADGSIDYDGKINHIKGRGNATWGASKKPYTIELPYKSSLLGMEMGDKWVLLANFYDASGIRNKLVYDAAASVGLMYSPDSEFLDLYINNQYYGLYQLAEMVDVGESRVDIRDLSAATQILNVFDLNSYYSFEEESEQLQIKGIHIPINPTDLSGGYLLELELPDRYKNEPSGFITSRGQHVVIRSPKYASREQVVYIGDYFQEFEDALYDIDGINHTTGKSYTEYIDLASWAKKYILDEVSKNLDSGLTSDYFYKLSDAEGALLYAGPVWDYDHSLGDGVISIVSPKGFVNNKINKATSFLSFIYPELYKKSEFYNMLVKTYKETFVPSLNRIIDVQIDSTAERINASWKMDKRRWQSAKKSPRDPLAAERDTVEEHARYIKGFLRKRIAFLSSAWIDGVDYCTVRFYDADRWNRDTYYSVIRGDNMVDLPVFESNGYIFDGWRYKDTDVAFDPSLPINDDIELYAKWIKAPIDIFSFDFIKQLYINYRLQMLICTFLIMLVALGIYELKINH